MHTILVADDSVTILKAVEIVFDKEPFQVVKAGSGAEAIARAKELKPALVLTDHLMSDKTGYEVAEALHADPSTSGIPVMILSGSSAPYDEGRAKAAGVIGHLPKPFDCQTLLDRVRNVLGVPATAPGTAVPATPAASTGSLTNMPRPPGAASSMPRPPGLGGLGMPRPPATNPGAPTGLAAAGLAATTPMNRAPTPQPARADLDPFGFGGALQAATAAAAASAPPAAAASAPPSMGPAPVSTPPRTTSASGGFSNPFATATSIGGAAATAPVVSAVASSPMPSTPAPASSSAPKTSAPSYVSESEFLEVADIEVNDIPSTPSLPPQTAPAERAAAVATSVDDAERATDKIDIQKLARLDREVARAEAAREAKPEEKPKLEEKAAAAVVEKAATAIAQTGAAVPSKEALSEEARQIVERVAWEVVPELAEVIIREEIQRLLKSRG